MLQELLHQHNTFPLETDGFQILLAVQSLFKRSFHLDQMDPDEKIVEIAIERLRVFENHPFRVEMYCVGAEAPAA